MTRCRRWQREECLLHVTEFGRQACKNNDELEQKEVIDALCFPDEELRELTDAHAAVMELLKQHGLVDMTDHDVSRVMEIAERNNDIILFAD